MSKYDTFKIAPTAFEDILLFYSFTDPFSSTAVNKIELENQARESALNLSTMVDPTDEQLLDWARRHYPVTYTTEEKERNQDIVDKWDKIKELLEQSSN